MTLQLPPDRPLDHPERMIETILAGVDAGEAEPAEMTTLGRTRRSRYLLGALAAAAVGVVGVVGVTAVGQGQRDRIADPPSRTAAAPAPAASSPSAPIPSGGTRSAPIPSGGTRSAPIPLSLTPTPGSGSGTSPAGVIPTADHLLVVSVGTPVTFANFTVTVDQLQWGGAQGLQVHAEVCVQNLPDQPTNGNTTRISWDPWTVNSSTASFGPQLADPSHPPADLFRSQDFYRVGECARGWLPFADAPDTTDLSAISYRNEFGDQAIWVPAGAKSDLDRKVTFPYLTVSVGGIIAFRREYAINVSTCVTKLPPGTPKAGLRLSREPWRLETDHGVVTIDDPLTDIVPLPPTYTQGGRYHVGDCVTGYIPFGISRGAVVSAIRYDNALGDHAVWLPRP